MLANQEQLPPEQAIPLLQTQLQEPAENLRYNDPKADVWYRVTLAIVERAFGQHSRNANDFACTLTVARESPEKAQRRHVEDVVSKKGMLAAFIKELEIIPRSRVDVDVSKRGVFFAGQTFDGLSAAARILATATSHLLLIDAFIGAETLNLLPTNGIAIDILTKPPVSPAVKTLCGAFKAQYTGLQVRTCSTFHDRFVDVDKDALYHFGASIKDLGKRTFMFSLIEEPDILATFRRRIATEWAQATVVV